MNKLRIIKIGTLVIFSLVVLIWGISYLKGLSLLKQERYYYGVYDKIGGLSVSSRIMLNGYQVGQVENIEFDTTDYRNLLVTMVLTENVKIPMKSIARIISSDLMGTKEINFIFYDTIPCHNPGDTILTEIEAELREEVNAQIAPLKKKATELIQSFDSVLIGVQSIFTNKTRDHIAMIFENIHTTIAQLTQITAQLDLFIKDEKGNISSIISNIDSISGTLANNTKEISNIFNNISTISDSLSRVDFAGTIEKANKAFTDISEITNKINSGEGTLGLLLNDTKLYNNLNKASEELDLLLKDLKENPKRYVHYSVFGGKEKKAKQNLE